MITKIPKNFLLYEREARRDIAKNKDRPNGPDWLINDWRPVTYSPDMICKDRKVPTAEFARTVGHDPAYENDERTSRSRGEELYIYRNTQAAREAMTVLTPCKRATAEPIANLGSADEGWTVHWELDGQTQRAAIVRRGAAVAIYGEVFNDAKPLGSMEEHVRDARRMAAKLDGTCTATGD